MPEESIIVCDISWILLTVKPIFLNRVHQMDIQKIVIENGVVSASI